MNKIIKNNGEDIFRFLIPENNDILSNMNGIDLQELLILLDDYNLEYRELLGIDKNITFGFEIECEYSNKRNIKYGIENFLKNDKWIVKDDVSLKYGSEINSPILKDKKKSWEELNLICDVLNRNALIGNNSGGHIHIGSSILSNKIDLWDNYILLWLLYENVILRFTNGEFLNERSSRKKYACSLMNYYFENYKKLNKQEAKVSDYLELLKKGKYYAVNFDKIEEENIGKYVKNSTIEFRLPNGSLEPVIWQNNFNFFVSLLERIKSKIFDRDVFDKRFYDFKPISEELYNEIFLNQALELCDLVFTNNFDKMFSKL